jgi:hypothetical protein
MRRPPREPGRSTVGSDREKASRTPRKGMGGRG